MPLFHHLTARELNDFWANDHLKPGLEIPFGLCEQA